MTDLAEEIDLDAAAEGVKSLYKAPQPKVLDPEAMDKSLLERMPAYWLAHVNPPISR